MKLTAIIPAIALLMVFSACDKLSKKEKAPEISATPPTAAVDPDTKEITDAIHGFFNWYAVQSDKVSPNGAAWKSDFISDKGKHLKLDATKLDRYFATLRSSGFISEDFIKQERAILKKCEALWQKENKDDVPSCLDADRFYCAQDGDINFWTKGNVVVSLTNDTEAAATLSDSLEQRHFMMTKQNGKWLIKHIECQMLPEEPPLPYALVVNQNGDITLGSKKIAFDNLKKELEKVLLKEPKLPNSMPIKYEGEVLMGVRSEISTAIDEAVAAVKKAKKGKAISVTNTSKNIKNAKPAQSKPKQIPSVVVNQKGDIKLSGKKVELEDLRKDLQNTLVKEDVVPDKIPITYEGKPLMGLRGEVETEVRDAIAGAKWIKKSQPVVTAKSPTAINMTVNKKGEMTLAGKKVTMTTLKKDLQSILVKQTVIPNDIPISFNEEILMGTRNEVRTEVAEAVAGAKWLRKKAALNALQATVEKKLTIPIKYDVTDYKTAGTFALANLSIRHKNGKTMDYKGTPYEKTADSMNTDVWGLLKYENGVWKVITHTIGATLVPYSSWQKEYNAPKELFF